MCPGPIEDPFDERPPEKLTGRVAYAERSGMSTFRFPGDRKKSEMSRWFSSAAGTHPVRHGNEVEYLVDGGDTYKEMAAAIDGASGPQHFVYLLGWICIDDFPFAPDGRKFRDLLAQAAGRAVEVRAMLWDQAGFTNSDTVKRINLLQTGASILDNRTLPNSGSHHQKVLIVNGKDGLVAFCGGIDVNPDRVFPRGTNGSGQPGAPMHDVHCRLRGPVTSDVLKTFVERWSDHPASAALDSQKGVLRGKGLVDAPQPSRGRLQVQIGRTYGNALKHGFSQQFAGQLFDTYAFAPQGETSAAEMFFHAIGAAKRFIYIEDQYLVHNEAAQALIAALPRLKHITIVIPDSSISDLPQVYSRRKAFITPLRAAGGDKVRIFRRFPAGPGVAHSYVHAKTWVFDDEFAIIGSANCNRRSWTHDSEFVAGVYDESSEVSPTYTFAHRLRVKLWAEHLDMANPDGYAALGDPIAGAYHFHPTRIGSSKKVAPFDETVGSDAMNLPNQVPWLLTDPDGR